MLNVAITVLMRVDGLPMSGSVASLTGSGQCAAVADEKARFFTQQ